MSQIARDYSVSVRLSPDEKAQFEKLASRLGLDKSATLRHALKSLSAQADLPQSGCFVVSDSLLFPIQLKKESHD